MDRNGDGLIDASDLSQAFMAGNDRRGVCRESLAEVDRSGEQLSWSAFLKLMQSPKEVIGSSKAAPGDDREGVSGF